MMLDTSKLAHRNHLLVIFSLISSPADNSENFTDSRTTRWNVCLRKSAHQAACRILTLDAYLRKEYLLPNTINIWEFLL